MRRKIFFSLSVIAALLLTTAIISDAQRMVHPTTGRSYPIYCAPYSATPPPFGTTTVLYAMTTNYAGISPLMLTPANNIPTRTLGVSGMLTRYDSTNTTDLPLAGAVRGVQLVDNTTLHFTNIILNASTVVPGGQMILGKVIVNVAGTASTVALYNDSTSPCDSNYVCTLQTTATGIMDINHTFSNAICALTAGTAAADISLLRRTD